MTGIAAAIAAADGINKVVALTKTVADLVKRGATIELQERITELREAVLDAKDEVLELREENQVLRSKLSEQDAWNARAAEYELVTTNGGATVWHTVGPPEHFACPACFEKKTINILQDVRNYGGDFRCPGCDHTYPVRPEQVDSGRTRPSVVLKRL